MESPLPQDTQQTPTPKLRPDGSTLIGLLMLLGVGAAFLFGGTVRYVIGLLCLLVTLRAVFSIWTLGLVQPANRVAAVQARLNLYVLGAIGAICGWVIPAL